MNPLTQSKSATILPVLIALTLGCFALSPQARAVCQEGCLTNQNTVLGDNALLSNTGSDNTAIGFEALFSNTTGINNTAVGASALSSNTTGLNNTANGVEALGADTTGLNNTANGAFALQGNTTGNANTANGAFALQGNTTGGSNTATGLQALNQNTTGFFNTATGGFALFSNTTGAFNTATGISALNANTTGINNTASGYQALSSNTTGSNNIALGVSAGINLTTGNNNIDIGNAGVAGDANTIRIGTQGTQTATFIAGISETPIGGGGRTVRVNANGQLGTAPSSARFKQNIQPMDKASEAIHALKPVTFRYNKNLDPDGTPQFGLVAEDVEKVNPDLVARDAKGEVYTVRYEAVNAMLLNEFLKQHNEFLKEQRTVQEQQKEIDALKAELKEQRALIQKVNDKMELDRPAPQTVLNNQ